MTTRRRSPLDDPTEEFLRFLAGKRKQLAFHETPAAPSTVPTFKALAESWPAWYRGLYGTKRYNTDRNHGAALHAFLPTFGGLPVSEITRAAVQDFILAKRGTLADTTLRVYMVSLKLVLDFAVEKGHIAANPLRVGGLLWKPAPPAEPDPFDHEELAAIVGAAEVLSPSFGLMVRVWAQSGMRSGEIRGLRRGDLDPLRGEVRVERTLTHGRTGDPKTPRSRRRASLLYPVCEATGSWEPGATPESRSVLERLAKVVPLDQAAPLFGSLADPRKPMQENELEKLWGKVITSAQIRRRTPETLRHSHVSAMLSRGARCSECRIRPATARG